MHRWGYKEVKKKNLQGQNEEQTENQTGRYVTKDWPLWEEAGLLSHLVMARGWVWNYLEAKLGPASGRGVGPKVLAQSLAHLWVHAL